MKKIIFLIITLLLSTSTLFAKNYAPLKAECEIIDNRAIITLVFESEASDVNVEVRAVDNINIYSNTRVIYGESFSKYQTREFDVAFDKKEGKSYIAVFVTGIYKGKKMHSVFNFQTGKADKKKVLESLKQKKNMSFKKGFKGQNAVIYDLEN